MSCIDLNEFGRIFFKEKYNKTKKEIPFKEYEVFREISFDKIYKYVDKIKERINRKNWMFIEEDYIDLLKNVFMLCYIDNINLNKSIQVKLKYEDNNTVSN